VYSGKTWKNLMIDLRLSNNKLIDRAINRVIRPITLELGYNFSEDEIIHHLNNNSNYYLGTNYPLDRTLNPSVYVNIEKLIPTTILTLCGLSYKTAREKLDKERSVRMVLQKNIKKK